MVGLAFAAIVIGIYLAARDVGSAICTAVEAHDLAGVSTPVRMVVYNDFQCPACRELNEQLRSLRGSSKVEIVHRQYPLDSACNPWVSRTKHPGACMQARAAVCAGRLGRYDTFSDRLFDRGSIGIDELIGLATSVGIDSALFSSCLASADSAAQLAQDVRTAKAQQVRGTPTIFVGEVRRFGLLRRSELQCLESTPR
jgi:protein-disulfide isomerase